MRMSKSASLVASMSLALFWAGVTAVPAQAATNCVSDYNYIVDEIRKYHGFGDAVANMPKAKQQNFESRLRNCLKNESDANRRGITYKMLADVVNAQGKNAEALGLYRRTVSARTWPADDLKYMNGKILDIIWLLGNRRDYIRESDRMIKAYRWAQKDKALYSRRGRALEERGDKVAAINAYITSANLDTAKRKSHAAKEALRLQRALYWRKSCAVLTTKSQENYLANLNDCLAGRRLPGADRVLALRLRGEYFEANKDNAQALASFEAIAATAPYPPVFTALDLGQVLYGSGQGHSVMSKVIGYQISLGRVKDGIITMKQAEIGYEKFLSAASAKGSDFYSRYDWAADTAKRTNHVQLAYLSPVVDWLSQTNNHAYALGLLDAALSLSTTPLENRISLRFKRGQLQAGAGDFEAAISDFTAVINVIPSKDNPTRRSALVNRAATKRSLGDLSAALADADAYFDGWPVDWYARGVGKEAFDVFVFRAEMAARSGAVEAANSHIATLQKIHDDRKLECVICTELKALMK